MKGSEEKDGNKKTHEARRNWADGKAEKEEDAREETVNIRSVQLHNLQGS